MTRFRTSWVCIACTLAAAALSACSATRTAHAPGAGATAPKAPAAVNHIVLFDLRDPADADALTADSRVSLGRIPGVISLFAGRHLDTGRPTVRADYDACVYIGFATTTDYAEYLKHPEHTGLLARWKDRIESYTIYDVADTTYAARP